ncbi:MAG: M81 family metallopeptidase, partial [Alphaproteobacteria bacterium]
MTEHLEDGEGEVLRRVRAIVGPEVPVVSSLDLHANITPEMIDFADCLVAYRSYPHIDFADTGARAAGELDRLLGGRGGQGGQGGSVGRHKAFRQFPFLIPVLGGCTLYEPAQSLYARLPELEGREGVDHVSLAMGFGPADIYHCGPSVCAYGTSQAAADQAADVLAEEILAREAEFRLPVWSPADGVARAIALAAASRRPVVLADSQDNPGGGGNGDTVGLLKELVRQQAEGAALAILYDPEAAAAAHTAGEGAELSLGLGAKSGLAGHR